MVLIINSHCFNFISIRTPVRGVMLLYARWFQSAHPWGVWLCWSSQRFLNSDYFNPHTRDGCDDLPSYIGFHFRDFNPHTREGCDRFTQFNNFCINNFNPHTREGCDVRWVLDMVLQYDFNLRTRVGCDGGRLFVPSRRCDFNPRTRVGCDRYFCVFF